MEAGRDGRRGRSAARERRSGRGGSHAITCWRDAAVEGLATCVSGGTAAYDRARTLPRLIAFDPRELAADGADLDRSIRARLERALRAERNRGRAGHWTYDLNRHFALLQAVAAEDGAGRPEWERSAARKQKAPPV